MVSESISAEIYGDIRLNKFRKLEWVWRRIWNISPYSFHNIVHCAESIRMDQLCLWNPTTRELKRLNFTYGLQIIRNIAARCVNLLRSEGGKVKCRLTKHIIKLLSWNIVISLRVKKVMYLLQFVPYILSTKSLIKFDLRSPMIETACISRKVKSVRSYKTTFFIHSQT